MPEPEHVSIGVIDRIRDRKKQMEIRILTKPFDPADAINMSYTDAMGRHLLHSIIVAERQIVEVAMKLGGTGA